MNLSLEAEELLALGPDPSHIAEALDGVEKVLRGFDRIGGQWVLTDNARSICATADAEAAFRRLVSARDNLRAVLDKLRKGSA